MFKSATKLLVIVALLACQAVGAESTFFDRPIPPLNNAPTTSSYHQIPIDLNSRESHEPLVDGGKQGIAADCYYARDNNAPYFHKFASASDKVFVRQTVAHKLLAANKLLKPFGVEVLILDGYRPIELQRELWDYFVAQAKKTLKHPTEEDCVKFAGTFCADPRKFNKDDWHTWPSHITGGAVDVTLREIATRRQLNMGGTFDDASEVSYTDYYEHGRDAASADARRNRRLLYGAMTAVGFTNYPYEWWHFDYGTQMWVMNSRKQQQALYGRADAPEFLSF